MNAQNDEPKDEAFEALLRYLRDARGFDFTGYKRTSLMRRVRHQMDSAGYETFEEYLDVLQASADEFVALFNTILINVTAFFRDTEAWDFVRDDVIPMLLAERGPNDPVRVWSAGCASGQEAYTLAMLLAEALGIDEFRQRVKIYATDVDENALAEARAATYDTRAVDGIPPEYLARYFENNNGGKYVFRPDLRRGVIFGRNDLVKDAPISRVDLLVCRNTLMYLNADTQRNVVSRLHFALAPQGTLFLGHAEMLLSHSDRFAPLELKHRLFRKSVGSGYSADRMTGTPAVADRVGELGGLSPIRDLAFRASPVAQIVVNSEDTIAMVNQQAETSLGLSARDIGRLLRDLEVSYRPVELRGYIEQAKVERRSARIQDVQWQRAGAEPTWYEIHVNPLVGGENGLLGVSIVFFDVTATRSLLDKVVQTNRQLETAYEELQSTNEELETINEELQSTNDELHTINDTLRESGIELDNAKTFVESLVNSIHLGMALVDREMRVTLWNRGCEDLWGLRREEVEGRPLTSLDIGLPLEPLKPLIGHAFIEPEVAAEKVVDAVNRRGRSIQIRVTCNGFHSDGDETTGALLVMEVVD